MIVDAQLERTTLPAAYPRQQSVHGLFAEVCRAHSTAPALLTEARTFSYAELDRLSIRVARGLRAAGVDRGSIVGILTERSPETVIAWLAALRCGAAYLPLDAAYPAETLGFMISDARPVVLLRAAGLAVELPAPDGTEVLGLEALIADGSRDAEPWCDTATGALDPAYVMYTSGSTGRPKGVVVPHRGIVRLVRDQNYMEFSSREVFLLVSALTFDVSTWEVWGSALNGAKLAIVPGSRLSLDQISGAVRRFGVTSVYLTSALFNVVIEQDPQILKGIDRLLVGGDVMSPEHSLRAIEALPGCELVNAYGPTEATTYCVCYRLDPKGWGAGSVPIGVPLNHDRAYILDDQLVPVPEGEIGMLWAAGDGVALGYLNRPELTAERFKPDPFATEPDGKMYFTGDLARMRPDGLIECLGRIDRQVKIDGKRIELDEIEHAFRRDKRLADAVAVLEKDGATRKRVVVFLKSAGTEPSEALRESVLADYRARMPEHMVPHETLVVAAYPFNRNGKVDREALLASARQAQAASATPAVTGSDLERTIAGLWRDALRRADFGMQQNFFDCGGTSLAMVEVHSRLQAALGRQIPITELFAHPTVTGLAAALTAATDRPTTGAAREAGDRASRQKAALARLRNTRG
jgi:amino acid adenylation domain-containing protein